MADDYLQAISCIERLHRQFLELVKLSPMNPLAPFGLLCPLLAIAPGLG